MYIDLEGVFWWNNMKREISKYVAECYTCQKSKIITPNSHWKVTTSANFRMETGRDLNGFYARLPMTKNHNDMIWIIVNRFTKSAYFLVVNQKNSCEKLAKIY
jgi:hypothetical protein